LIDAYTSEESRRNVMDYSALLQRSWEIVWNNKWMILLGIIVALSSGGGGGGNSGFQGSFGGGDDFDNFNGNDNFNDFGDFSEPPTPEDFGLTDEQVTTFLAIGVPLLIVFVVAICLVSFVIWGLGRVATGGLITAADTLDRGESYSFGQAWRAGWARGWRMIGVGFVAAIPGLVFLIVALALVIPIVAAASSPDDIMGEVMAGIGITFVALLCLMLLFSIPLSLLRGLADRAAMLEDTGVFDSYSRAWSILRDHLGEAIVVALIHVGAQIALAFALIVPSLMMALCCLLWPVALALSGAIVSYFSTMWTLAWRHWTGRSTTPLTGPLADIAPAV
jgi:hypothetical protein